MSLIKSISGIRGTIGGRVNENLTPVDIVRFTAAYSSLLLNNKNQFPLTLAVGRDARISGDIVSNLVCSTLRAMGINVIDLGLSTTPTVEMFVIQNKIDGGIILTASHNPLHWNALKLLNNKGEFLSAKEGNRLLEIAEKQEFEFADIKNIGAYTKYENAITDHIDAILKLNLVDVQAIINAHFSVIVDCINSTGSIAIPLLLEKLGVSKVKLVNGEATGIFAHNPEPLPEYLSDISNEMKKNNYHVGFVVDPDVDRLAIVMEDGEMFGEEYTLVAVADYILQHSKGNAVSNLSSTRALGDICKKYGVEYHSAAVGEVNVVEKMKKIKAIIGGEGNGGVIYPELHYGRDALIGIALFLSFMAKTKKTCSEIRRSYPSYFISKNKIELKPEMNVKSILKYIAEKYANYQVSTIDGVKIDFEESWVHLRPSNTESIIRIYAEAMTASTADNIASKLISDIREFLNE